MAVTFQSATTFDQELASNGSPLRTWVSRTGVSSQLTQVTYHRFLRFYPDGSVISFLTTDHPSEVVPILNQDLRAKGLHLGQWQLFHDVNDKGKKRTRVLISQLFEPGGSGRYEFAMELSLRETNRGRWNKLDLNQYSSIQLDTGEVLGLSLKHQKPFYFSKCVQQSSLLTGRVRSFQHAF